MRRQLASGLVLALSAVAVAGCSNPYAGGSALPTPLVTSVPVTQAPGPGSSTSVQPTDAGPDELEKGSARHVVKANGLTVRIDYAAPVPAQWTSDAGTPLQVTVSLHNDRRPKQKIYLTRATVRILVSDGSSYLPSPDPLVESSNLSPGYLATSPYAYVQSFSVPGLDESAQKVVVNVKFDLVSLVDGKARDYTKQSVTDSIATTVRA